MAMTPEIARLRYGRVVCSILAVVFLLVALGFAIPTERFRRRSVPAEGVVVANQEQRDGQGTVTYLPVLRFQSQDGREITAPSDTSVSPAFAVGTEVRVLYDPNAPENVKINSFWQLWLFPILFGLVGAVLRGVGWVLLLIERKKEKQQESQVGQVVRSGE